MATDNIARAMAARAGKASKQVSIDVSEIRTDVANLKSTVDNSVIDALFRLPRTGAVYSVQIPKFASNQTTVCTKIDDNAGLVCEPSTDTVTGRDDYADIPLFRWYNCNYLRDEHGHAYPTAIEGIDDTYTTTGNIDVGVIQMAPYIKCDDSSTEYTILSITDMPRDGYMLWCEAASNGVDYPYVIHSKYISGVASDGKLRSIPGLKPARGQSYNNMITNYAKKGAGYFGAPEARNTWQIVFTLLKYAQKSSQKVFAGCTSYNLQYAASVQRTDKDTYFPLTKTQATNILVGSYVSVGYGGNNNGAVNNDRGVSSIHKYADDVRVLRIETIDDANSAVYLDVDAGFDTTPVALTATLKASITLSTMHWTSGTTDAVIGRHDGSVCSNTDGKHPYRVQGIEYAVGGYTVSSDTIMDFQSDYSKNVLVAPRDNKRTANAAEIKSTYRKIGNIVGNGGNDFWIGDIAIDTQTGATYPATVGSGDSVGTGDKVYGGGKNTSGTREYLRGGNLGNGSSAGSSYLDCWNGPVWANWAFLSAD